MSPSLSIIVPTYREAENLPELIDRIDRVRQEHGLSIELLIMDDDSGDGTEDVIKASHLPWVRLIVRTKNRGLSPAVIDGLRLAQNEVLLVMDADLSHPPEKIPEMLHAISSGCDFVIGSRYVAGASTDENWGLLRWLNSRVATLLARPFTSVKDPMSGFFALPRTTLDRADHLNPVGYKIGLELLVKCRCKNVGEVPIHFANRRHGQSKLSLAEQLRYIQHLRRLFIHRYANLSYLAQFLVVGFSGMIVNLLVLTLLLRLTITVKAAVAVAIVVSMISNFVFNRRFTFSYAKNGPPWRQFFGFMAACSAGAVVNYATTLGVMAWWAHLSLPQVAAVIGIAAGTALNFLSNRYLVFRGSRTTSSCSDSERESET